MTSSDGSQQKNSSRGLLGWIEFRLPIISFLDRSVGTKYPAPRNLTYLWNFGSLAGLALVLQIITGCLLYTSDAADE